MKLRLALGAALAAIGALLAALMGARRRAGKLAKQRDHAAEALLRGELEAVKARQTEREAAARAEREREREAIQDELEDELGKIDHDLGGAVDDALDDARRRRDGS